MTHQEAYMLVAPVKPGRVDALRATLACMNQPNVDENPLLPFGQLQRVHFARFIILDEGTAHDGTHYSASLVFSTCYDPPTEAHLSELLDVGEAGLRAVFAHCEGFDENASRTDILVFLEARRKTPETFYIGVRGRSLMQIRAEAALREHLEIFLDSTRTQSNQNDAKQLRERMQQNVLAHKAELGWAAEPEIAETLRQKLWDFRWLAVIVGLALLALFVAARIFGLGLLGVLMGLAAGLWLLLLRRHEKADRADPLLGEGPDDDPQAINKRITALAELEDVGANNQFSSLNRIKRGAFRKFTSWAVLTTINFAARYFGNNRGRLADIPTIHFARWVLVDGGRRMLFESNFDGSWERYLGDFVDKARTGLTAVWSNTVGFPPSKWLVCEGAADEQPFKWVARVSQIKTEVWYSAYPNLTVKNILNNRAIHRGLFGEMDNAEASKWLKRF